MKDPPQLEQAALCYLKAATPPWDPLQPCCLSLFSACQALKLKPTYRSARENLLMMGSKMQVTRELID